MRAFAAFLAAVYPVEVDETTFQLMERFGRPELWPLQPLSATAEPCPGTPPAPLGRSRSMRHVRNQADYRVCVQIIGADCCRLALARHVN